MIEMANKNYGDWFKYLPTSTQNFLQGGNYYSPVTVQPPTANYQFSFERPNNNGGFNWQKFLIPQTNYNFATSTPVQPTIQPAQTPQATQTAITPENNPNYYASSDLLNLPSNQDIVNEYNKWRKNNPNAVGIIGIKNPLRRQILFV